jgi:hypothetical protein
LSSQLSAAKKRYAQNKHDACKVAVEALAEPIGVDFQITEISGRALRYIQDEWGGSHFEWADVLRKHNEPDAMPIAIWHGERLCAVSLILTTGQAVVVRFLEGDPRSSCPLKGRRFLIALEAATNYAQARGKKEIRLQPKNDALVYLYEKVYGFALESPKNEAPYYRKGV